MAPRIPDIPETRRSEEINQLFAVVEYQREVIQELRDEIARLKGQKPRPAIKPSALGEDKGTKEEEGKGKDEDVKKRSKKEWLRIDEERIIKAQDIPEGSRFKGYADWDVQDLDIKVKNLRFRLEKWELADGSYVQAQLPGWVKGHYSSQLVSYVLHQYYGCHVTQPLIMEQLKEFGVYISTGQINEMLVGLGGEFGQEKAGILEAGLAVSSYINVDDTGARHEGKNGYCTHIGNEVFSWFESTASKSRVNFLELLQEGVGQGYVINEEAIGYMGHQKMPQELMERLAMGDGYIEMDRWEEYVKGIGIKDQRHIKIATEAGLIGSLVEHGINKELAIVSDDAGQFDIWALLHGLCWLHAERPLKKMIGFNGEQRGEIEEVRAQVWDFYDELKAYKTQPDVQKAAELEVRFDQIFLRETGYEMLKENLRNIHKNKKELLLVLDRPDIPLHNNTSEQAIREYVKRRKISGSTRSDRGRWCRDTFTSLKKTCRKLGLSFWGYLNDRISGENALPNLGELIRQNHLASTY